MNDSPSQAGFSAVELLIALLIASLFILMGYQLYGVVAQDGGQAREFAKASNIAYEKLRRLQTTGTGVTTCPATSTSLTPEQVDNNKATLTVTVSCPTAAALPSVRLVVVKVKYNATQREASHAIYVSETN